MVQLQEIDFGKNEKNNVVKKKKQKKRDRVSIQNILENKLHKILLNIFIGGNNRMGVKM